MRIQKRFGQALRRARKEKGISQENLALEADLDRAFIGRLERGETQPTLTTLFAIAKVLRIRASELIARMER